jgi:hypothetical protein
MRRSFLGTHWKSLLVILILVLVAVLTLTPSAASPTLATRLRAHVQAITPDGQQVALASRTARYIEATLIAQGWRVRRVGNGAAPDIEIALGGNPGRADAQRSFIIGVHYAGHSGVGTAAVLELARLLRPLRPSPGTEIGFVFLGPRAGRPAAGAGDFIAFAGSGAASSQVVQALAAFRAGVQYPGRGLAAHGWVQGVTLAVPAGPRRPASPALVVAPTAFLDYPYLATAGTAPPGYDDTARVVAALARTLAGLAAGTAG